MKEQSKNHDKGVSSDSKGTQVTPEGIRAQMDRILSSPDFKASNKVKTIFRYLTEEKLAGRGEQINAGSILEKTHNRPLDPDALSEPLARIRMNQLRRALKRYDVGTGASDGGPQIDMPANSFVPVFHSEKK